jgi:CBS domain-containing protein
MTERQIKRLPVVEDDRLVGIVSRADVLRAAYERIQALHEDAVPPRSDAEIVSTLIETLRVEPWAEVGHIRPTCSAGLLTLNGEAESAAERDAIEIAARGITGVREVRNLLVIQPSIADEG